MRIELHEFKPLVVALHLAFGLSQAWAQSQSVGQVAPPVLTPAQQLQEALPKEAEKNGATYVTGDSVSGKPEAVVIVKGNAELRKPGTVIRADTVQYQQSVDKASASGNVRMNRLGNVYEGTELDMNVGTFEGFFLKPQFQLLKNQAVGDAERVDFLGEKKSVITNARYSTCRRVPGEEWLPDWLLKATRLEMDTEEDIGVAEGAVLRFKDVPILALPTMSFPLSSKRKSGMLPPTVATDSLNGLEITTPYYLNIAPNQDATLYPTVSSKRGINLGAEYRYLQPNYGGQTRFDLMPNDKLRDSDRWGLSSQHQQRLDTSVGVLGLNLNLNRVSDDNYWRDFPRAYGSLTQRLLPSDFSVNWGRGAWNMNLLTSKWQTLQDLSAPIVPPYDRLPQWTLNYNKLDLGGFDVSAETQVTRFKADTQLTGQANGTRALVSAQVSRPFKLPGFYITPKLSAFAANYKFDTALSNGVTRASLALPTFSLDTGLVFDRDATFFGRSFVQTLEPRAFYVYTPYRDQSLLPNYDSAARDFNFASLFTENPYSGYSRVADNNLLTLGVSSKLLDPATGAEVVRLGMAQRLRFAVQNVTLPGGATASDRLSDLLLGGTVNWDPKWSLETTQQISPTDFRSTRATVGLRYTPGSFKVLNAAYRYQKDSSEQIEMSWQWPLGQLFGGASEEGRAADGGRWYTMGRMNYSINDKKLVDSVVGFEYDAGCWVGRAVLENVTRSDATTNKRILFQIDLIGFASLGQSTLKTLRSNIPRYQSLRETIETPGRFSNFE
jgi:LPS-assembly protein